MWKANSQVPLLNAIDAKFRDMAFRHGLVYTRWLRCVDVELLKEPGNFNIEKLRFIVLVEGDNQMNVR